MTSPENTPESRLLVMQIIAAALPMGVVTFAVVAVIVTGFFREPPTGQFLSLFGIGFAGLMFVAHLIIPRQIADAALKSISSSDPEAYYGVYQSQMLVGLALLEGAAFLNLVALIVERNWWSLAVAGGLVLWMLALFPTRTRVDQWVETQQLN